MFGLIGSQNEEIDVRCSYMCLARIMFDENPERDLVSWILLNCGYGQCKGFREVRVFLKQCG